MPFEFTPDNKIGRTIHPYTFSVLLRQESESESKSMDGNSSSSSSSATNIAGAESTNLGACIRDCGTGECWTFDRGTGHGGVFGFPGKLSPWVALLEGGEGGPLGWRWDGWGEGRGACDS